jgi:NAD-dependent dihydropyrimidine dehydrogenase PreA subunit
MAARFKWVPVIEAERCTGCGLCLEFCRHEALTLRDNVVTLARPDACGSEEHCLHPCPEDALRMDWVPLRGNPGVGLWRI